MIVKIGGVGRGALNRLLDLVSTAGFIGGIVQIVTEGSKPAPPRIRALAAVGFLIAGAIDGVRMWNKMRQPSTGRRGRNLSLNLGWLLAFDRATPHYHAAPPWWLTALAIVVLVAFMVSIAQTIYLWRRDEDERDRAIANGAMAIAFLATLTIVVFFALLQSTTLKAPLQPSYVLLTAAGSFFISYYALRRRM